MKFIQLLSTIASLAIFATAPGVSAAGLRATGDARDRAEEASGRRNLQGMMIYGMPGQVPGMPGPHRNGNNHPHYGEPGTVYGMPGGPHNYASGYYGDEGGYYGDEDYQGYGGGHGHDYDYEYGRAHSRGHRGGGGGGDAAAFCRKFKTRPACRAHDHESCGWDDSLGCHSY
jgi:hypothetical protein